MALIVFIIYALSLAYMFIGYEETEKGYPHPRYIFAFLIFFTSLVLGLWLRFS